MHAVLLRHLKRLELDASVPPSADGWHTLLERLSAVFEDTDRERYMLERSISISSREMQELYQELKCSSETQLALERDRLRNSVAILNATLETGIDGVVVVDSNRRVVMFNRMFVSLWHIPSAVAERKNDSELRAHVTSLLAAPDEFFQKVTYLYEHPDESSRDEILLKDGRVLDRFSAPVRAPDGDLVFGRMWLFRDVTAERRAVEEARRVNGFLDSIIENLPEMVFVKDAETLSFVRFNRAGEELLGWSRADLVGKNDYDFFPAEQAECFIAKDREVLRGREVVEIPEESIETRGRGKRLLHTKKIPIPDENGRPKYLLGISHDVTELRRHAEELEKARDAAEAASRAKSEFLANMSHELRTPLNAIIGFGEVLRDGQHGPLGERQRRDVDHVLESGRHLLRVISDILDLSRVEAGRYDLEPQDLDVFDAITAAADVIQPLAGKKRIQVKLQPTSVPLVVRVDALRLRQILINLLSNAVKFTPEGGDVRVSARTNEDGRVLVSVRDTGIGIAAEDQARIFAPFEQVDSSYARRQQGTGLGLALTRRLVELHDGRIWVESEIGLGSAFHFTLPPAPDKTSRAPLGRASSEGVVALRPGGRILVIEDNEANLELASTILGGMGYQVISARDAVAGIRLAQEAQPALVLLDIGLPKMDGFAAAAELKRDPQTANIPLVAVTAHALVCDEERARAVGFSGYLAKPIRSKALLDMVGRILCAS